MLTPYYERNGITIFNADCLDVMPELAPGFDAIIADLPYKKTDLSWDSLIPFGALWGNYTRLKKSNAAIVLTGGEPFTSLLVVSKIEWYRHKWVWEKDKAANFLHAQYMPIASCEDVIVFNEFGYTVSVKNKPTYNPQMTQAETYQPPNKSKSLKAFSLRQIKGGKKQTPMESSGDYDGWQRYPKSKLYFPVDYGKKRYHPTQKPVALLQYLIRTYTNPGELILDNAMGSGTTLLAAQNEGRRCVGIELEEEYCRIAVERLRQPSFFSLPETQAKEDKPKQGRLL
jgi:site-specific DNA-methyltransferase (adenine-specific)